jgi:enoyl-CoA hydratase/carnithine racemase
MSLVSTHVGRTLVLTIDRPPVNALDLAAVEALRDAFSAIGHDPPRARRPAAALDVVERGGRLRDAA